VAYLVAGWFPFGGVFCGAEGVVGGFAPSSSLGVAGFLFFFCYVFSGCLCRFVFALAISFFSGFYSKGFGA